METAAPGRAAKGARRHGPPLPLLAWLGLLSASCQGPKSDPAIALTIEVPAQSPSTCVKVRVRSGEVTRESKPIRTEGTRPLQVAIAAGDGLGGTLTIVAQGWVGKGCEAPLLLNDETPPVVETFEAGKVKRITVVLAPPAELDHDDDGWRAGPGLDCRDDAPQVNPARTEAPACADLLDNDCDADPDCEDSECQGSLCEDSNPCTTGEACLAQQCVGGTAVSCLNPPPGECFASSGSCSPQQGCGYLFEAGKAAPRSTAAWGRPACPARASPATPLLRVAVF